MSYANAQMSAAQRLRAATAAIGLPTLIGAGVIAGLAVTVMPTVQPDPPPVTWDIDDIPPPPPEPVEAPQTPIEPQSTVTAPDPLIQIPRDPVQNVERADPNLLGEVVLTPPRVRVDVPAPVPVPTIEPRFDPVGPVPRNGPSDWITNNDYPRRGIARELEGTTGYRLIVGSNGRVDACEVTRSSGHSVLDRATCDILESRARFDAAKNNRGDSVVGTYTGNVTWQLPRR